MPSQPKRRPSTHQHEHPDPPSAVFSGFCEFKSIVPGISPPTPRFPLSGVTGAHNSGVSRIFSTTSWNASCTPTAVLADASMNSEFIRVANCLPSAVGTWRENSYTGVQQSSKEGSRSMSMRVYLVHLVPHEDLHHRTRDVCLQFGVPPRQRIERLPAGHIVHCHKRASVFTSKSHQQLEIRN
jgi:hypothetical protein